MCIDRGSNLSLWCPDVWPEALDAPTVQYSANEVIGLGGSITHGDLQGGDKPRPNYTGAGQAFSLYRPATFLAEFDIGIAELDKANNQKCNGYAGHAQEVGPVHALENRVAVQVKDGERHDPGINDSSSRACSCICY